MFRKFLGVCALVAGCAHCLPSGDAEVDTSGFRFLNKNTTQYRVKSLPEIPFPVGELYAGSFDVTPGDPTRSLFAVFQPTIGAPVDEITVWFNGGPGCSSLNGFLEENGRWVYNGGKQPVLNKYSWVTQTNMLWVEYPVGVGFTQGVVTATDEQDAAKDFIGFFKTFQQTFGISKFKIYVTGESYAGRYVPYVSAAILDQKDTTHYDLAGSLMYDPCIGQYVYTQENAFAYPFLKAHPQFFNFTAQKLQALEQAHQKCGYEGYVSKYLTFPAAGVQPVKQSQAKVSGENCNIWNTIYSYASDNNKCFDVYEANQTCPTPYDPLQPASETTQPYFNKLAVKQAIHAPVEVKWAECNFPVFIGGAGQGGPYENGDDSVDSIQAVLPQVIEATNRVLVANGNYDYIIITNGTLTSIQNMTWNGHLGFKQRPSTPINVPGEGRTGTQHYERGLMWAETFKCGHFEPEFQPKTSLGHLRWLLNRTQTIV